VLVLGTQRRRRHRGSRRPGPGAGGGSGERQCVGSGACEWARARVSGPVLECFSCKNSLNFSGLNIFGGPVA
jgi:hypothetical protein